VGSLLFFYLSSTDTETKPQVTITQGKIKQLTAQFSKTRQRTPSDIELKALIKNQIREDLAFEHGVQMGLIENDSIIKRRVQQKIEFMLKDSIAGIEPSREDLETYLMEHKEQYTMAPIYSFKHVYINPEQHEDFDVFIEELQSQDLNIKYKNLGDSMMLESEYTHINTAQIARLFGRKFAKTLDSVSLESWQGPIKSGYGLHLVYIESKIPKHVAKLDEVEKELKRDFRMDAQKKAINAFYDALKVQYDVNVEEAQ
jgi:hypothetical protein